MADDSSATYISELDNTYPDGSVDTMDKVDNQLRMLKNLLETTFSGFTNGEAVTLSEQQVNNLAFTTSDCAVFYQAAAPTGWTEATIQANSGLQVVSVSGATGGSSGGTMSFSTSLAHTHTGPSHTHSMSHTHGVDMNTGTPSATEQAQGGTGATYAHPTHYHTISGTTGAASSSLTGSGGTGNTGSAIAGAFKYMNVIVCHPSAI